MHGRQEHRGRYGGTGAPWKVSCRAKRPGRNKSTPRPRRRNHQDRGKQQPTTSKKRALRPGTRNRRTKEDPRRGTKKAKKGRRFHRGQHQGQGGTCKMEGHNNQQLERDGVKEERKGKSKLVEENKQATKQTVTATACGSRS